MLAKREYDNLVSYAVKSVSSSGRKFKESDLRDRLCFQRDKERIIHCKAFRRLDKKTQVFTVWSGDHYRTRLTHTLEVAQISRDICRRLGLNEDLAETISLAHDLGHPPFGHVGEETLDEILKTHGRHFEHNEQSRLIVEKLEKSYPNFDGLNLTLEVLDGMIKHQTSWDQRSKKFEISAHLEAQVVNLADEIAYTAHDIDDGIRSDLIKLNSLGKLKLWKLALKNVYKKYKKITVSEVLIARALSQIIALLIEDLCNVAEKNIKKYKIKTVDDVSNHKLPIATFSENLKIMLKEMRMYLYKNFYMNPAVRKDVLIGKKMMKCLFEFYLKHPEKLPKNYYTKNKKTDILEAVKNYIAGMTDLFLLQEYERLIIKPLNQP